MHPFLNLRILKFLPIHLRRTSHFVSELPVEVGDIPESAVESNFQDALFCAGQTLARLVDAEVGNVFYGAESHIFLKLVHKVAFAQMHHRRKLAYRDVLPEMDADIFQCLSLIHI